jgi:hypothetical protein
MHLPYSWVLSLSQFISVSLTATCVSEEERKGNGKQGVGILLCVTEGEEGRRRREEKRERRNRGSGAYMSDGEERERKEEKKEKKEKG